MATKKNQIITFDTIDEICKVPATEISAQQLAEGRNYYNFDVLPKYAQHMPPQAELMEKVNGKYITFEQFLTEVQPTGQFWVSCNGELLPFQLSWEPGYVRFTDYGRREYAGLLKCVVEICAQGFLYLHYNCYNRAQMFISDMQGLSPRSRIFSVFG